MAISVTVNLTVLFRSFGNLPRRSGLGQDQDRCRQRSQVASMQTPASTVTVLTLTKLRSWRLETRAKLGLEAEKMIRDTMMYCLPRVSRGGWT